MKNRNLLLAVAFAVTCTTGLSAMQENDQDDNSGEITPRDQIITKEKILESGLPSTIKPSPAAFRFSPSTVITALTIAASKYFTQHIAEPTTKD